MEGKPLAFEPKANADEDGCRCSTSSSADSAAGQMSSGYYYRRERNTSYCALQENAFDVRKRGDRLTVVTKINGKK